MHKEFLMGNQAIALGAWRQANLAPDIPTPSTGIKTVAARNPGMFTSNGRQTKRRRGSRRRRGISGARQWVTMKQVNVASDPLMSLEYIVARAAW